MTRSSAPPFVALYVGDFLADIGHVGNTELGIYFRLLLVYYRDARPLPFDQDRLRRLAMTFSPEECKALETVIAEFFVLSVDADGSRTWRHKRADKELARAINAHQRKSEAAKATNARRWGVCSLDKVGNFVAKRSLSDVAKRPESDGEPEPEPEPLIHSSLLRKELPGSRQAQTPAAPPFDGKNEGAIKSKAVVALAAGWELPESWGVDAEALGWKPSDVIRQAERFRQYWTAGKGAGKRRSVKGWRQSWSNWLAKAAEMQR